MSEKTLKNHKKVCCRWCGTEIIFSPKVLSPNGRWIPLNPDQTKHDCPKSPYNLRKKMAENTVGEA